MSPATFRRFERGRWIAGVAMLSGFAGLGYEIVWARLLAVSLGHEIIAVLGVVTALFGGVALGSLMPGRRIARSPRPALWYAAIEIVIGSWALVLIPLFAWAGDLVPTLIPIAATPARHWSAAFAVPFVLLLPATMAMGATLPALESMLAQHSRHGQTVGRVYAANTLGAAFGTLATTFLLIPSVGLAGTMSVCAVMNFVCAGALWVGAGRFDPVAATPARPVAGARLTPVFLTGLLGIGVEILTIRVVSQILENTIYTFAVLLAAYLLGTAAGAALQSRLARSREANGLTTALVLATSLACVAAAFILAESEALLSALQAGLPPTMTGRLGAELGIAIAAFLPPTVAMGALFTALTQAVRDRDGGLGAALAVNTFGAALAPILFGPVLMPLVGAKPAFVVIALLYLLALPDLRVPSIAGGVLAAAVSLTFAASPLSLQFIKVPAGGGLVWHRDGVMAAVSVIRDPSGARHLQVNNHFRMGGTGSIRSDHREAHIPLLLHPNPRRALFLGLGTGATLSAAGDHPALVADGVELVPEVVESFPLFARSAPQLGLNPNLHVHVADARRFVGAVGDRYDVIVADLFHPALDGSGALYAKEHFAAIRSRLTEGGLFCQWLPLHQLDLATLRLIVRTFLAEFPQSVAYLAQFSVETPLIALIGTSAAKTYPADWFDIRVRDPALRARLAAFDLKDETALFGLYLAGTGQLRAFAGPGPLNTDDRPLVAATAPSAVYAMHETPGMRLLELLGSLRPRPEEVLDSMEPRAADRLANYWRARDRFISIGVETAMSAHTRNFVESVAPRLVEVVGMSGDFEAAYNPVLAMARQLARSDPTSARELLQALDRANPARPEAARLLAALPPS